MGKMTISYGFTWNRGNYQSERIDATVEINPEIESSSSNFFALKGRVHQWGGDLDAAEIAIDEARRLMELHKKRQEDHAL